MTKLEKLKGLIETAACLCSEDIYLDLDCATDEERESYLSTINELQSSISQLEREIASMKPVQSPFQTVDMWTTPKSSEDLEIFIKGLPEDQRANATHTMMMTWNFMASTIKKSLEQQQGTNND